MSAGKITLRDYIYDGNRTIIIPCYQRGYIWGKEHIGAIDSVSYMLKSLYDGFKVQKDIFVQGITVVEKGEKAVKTYTVIDGQQRTTFFFLLLKTLGVNKPFTIKYNSSRGKCMDDSGENNHENNPQEWLNTFELNTCNGEIGNESTQDVYFFKKTIRLMKKMLETEKVESKKEEFKKYILDHVYFLLIPIREELAVSTFTMINGNKAIMQDYELIKADLLRRASLGTGGYTDENASEWDNISLRSRYAHEWDRWLHWWKQKEVQLMFNCANPMGWLLKAVFEGENCFAVYLNQVEQNDNKSQKNAAFYAKRLFSKLRECQHKFEAVYTLPDKANVFGVIMRLLPDDKNKVKFIKTYFGYSDNTEKMQDLKQVADLLLMGFTYKEIVERNMASDKIEKFRQTLVENPIYGVDNELAYNYLLVRNVERDTALNRKFDFTIVAGNRSLEHVYPKSKVLHYQDGLVYQGNGEPAKDVNSGDFEEISGCLRIVKQRKFSEYTSRDEIQKEWRKFIATPQKISQDYLASMTVSEHSIGNLLLLYGNNNSEFGNKLPEEKRQSYFDLNKDFFSSRHLLHTVFSFAKYPKFDALAICKNQLDVIKDIEQRIKNVESLISENV